MPIIPVGLYDTIEGNIVTLLAAFSTAQKAIDSTVGFNVGRHRMRPVAQSELPYVHVWMANTSHGQGSGGRSSHNEVAHFNVDMHVKGTEGTGNLPSDEAAMARLYYLKEQVKYALYALAQADFGVAVGRIAHKSWPTYQTVVQRTPETEEQLVFGQWSFDVEYVWEADEAHTQALTRMVLSLQVKPLAPLAGVDKTFT